MASYVDKGIKIPEHLFFVSEFSSGQTKTTKKKTPPVHFNVYFSLPLNSREKKAPKVLSISGFTYIQNHPKKEKGIAIDRTSLTMRAKKKSTK